MDAVALGIGASVSNEGKDENDATPEAIGGNEAGEAEGIVDDDGKSDDLKYDDAIAGAASEEEAKSVDEKDDGAFVIEEIAVWDFAVKPSFADGLELERIAAVSESAISVVIRVKGRGAFGADEDEKRGDENAERDMKKVCAMPLEKVLCSNENARRVSLSFSLHGFYLSIEFSWRQVEVGQDWQGRPSQSG